MARKVVERDVDRDVVVERRGAGAGTTALTWLALILSIVALALGVAAYNRSGENIQDQAKETLNNAAEKTDQRINTENR